MPRRVARVPGAACTSGARSSIPVLAFVFVWYFGFIALAGYAPDFMGESPDRGLHGRLPAGAEPVRDDLGARLALPAPGDRVFDPLAKRAAERARLEHRRRRGRRRRRRRRRAGTVSALMITLPIAEVNVEAVAIFAVVVWRSPSGSPTGPRSGPRTRPRSGPRAAGSPASQNGFAIAGDYMSAASFLGIAGLIFLFGFDGFLYSVGFLVAFLIVLFLLAERMRNSGKFTIADVLSFRLNERPARVAAALGTLVVVGLLSDRPDGRRGSADPGAGRDRLQPRRDRAPASSCSVYVVFGGMLATTWVQIIKAVLLMTATIVLSLFVLGKIGWNPIDIFNRRRGAVRRRRPPTWRPACASPNPIDTISLGLGAAARHRRAAAHPDAVLHRARREGGALVGRLGRRPDRRLLRDDHVPRLRRPGAARRGRHDGRGRRGRQPRRAAAGPERRRRRGDDRR